MNDRALAQQNRYGAFAYVYDRLMAEMPYGEWLGWAEAYWAQYGRPGTAVDLGCGTGTMAISLAQSGLDVTGIDLSADMISVARVKEASFRKEAAIPGKLHWVVGDMRRWSLPTPTDAVVSFCDALNYLLTEDDLLLAFRATYEGLKPGGTFLFDMHHLNQLVELAANEPFCEENEDVSYIWSCKLDESEETIGHRLAFFFPGEDGRYDKVVETHKQRAYPESVVRKLLKEAGFGRVRSFGDFTLDPVDDAATMRMFFAAVREGSAS